MSKKGVPRSEECRRKISEALRGRPSNLAKKDFSLEEFESWVKRVHSVMEQFPRTGVEL